MRVQDPGRYLRRGLAAARKALRRRLSSAVADQECAHPRQGAGGRGRERSPSVVAHLSRRRLVRARNLRHVWHRLCRASRSAPHPHRLRLFRLSAAQGFPAHRLCRAALRRRTEARGLSAGAAGAGIPRFRFHEPLGRRAAHPAGRREGRDGARRRLRRPGKKP